MSDTTIATIYVTFFSINGKKIEYESDSFYLSEDVEQEIQEAYDWFLEYYLVEDYDFEYHLNLLMYNKLPNEQKKQYMKLKEVFIKKPIIITDEDTGYSLDNYEYNGILASNFY